MFNRDKYMRENTRTSKIAEYEFSTSVISNGVIRK